MNPDTSCWKEFEIDELFEVYRGKTLSANHREEYQGSIPCINGSAANNGILCRLDSSIQELGFKLHKAPALSLSRVGNAGKTFVQNEDFFVADNAFCLKLRSCDNIFVYQFLSVLLDLEMKKYCYGRTIAIERYRKIRIKLPVQRSGEIDYAFMEDYIKRLHYQPVSTRIKKSVQPLSVGRWRVYSFGELFDIQKGKRLTKADMIPGDVNFLGAISENNGIRDRILTDFTWKPNCITVNYNGSVGEAFYQDQPFWASDDVNILYAKQWWHMNKYNALFILTVIKANRYRFSYGRKWTLEKMKESILKLPAGEDGMPDFEYMESYIKSLPYSDRI